MVLTLVIVLMLTPFHGNKAEAFNGGTNSYTNLAGNSTFTSFSGGYATYSNLPIYGNYSGSSATYGSISSNFPTLSYANFGGLGGNVWKAPPATGWNPVPIGPGIIIVPAREPSPPDTDTGFEGPAFVSNPLKNPQWPLPTIPSMLTLETDLFTYPGYNTYPQIVNILPQITYPNYTIDFKQLWSNFPNLPLPPPILPWTFDLTPYLNSFNTYTNNF